MVEKAYADCIELISKAKLGKLENKPGCNQEQTLEAMISGVLSKVRGDVGDTCMKELSRHNAPLIMATCGSKGSFYLSITFCSFVECLRRLCDQRLTDGGLCWTADHIRSPCSRWIPGSIPTTFPQKVQGASVEGVRAQQFLLGIDAYRIFVSRHLWSRRSRRHSRQDGRNRLHATAVDEG